MTYADTNFLLKNYIPYAESTCVTTTLNGLRRKIPLTWLLEQEIINAIEQSVFIRRTSGQGSATPELAAAAQATFEDDLQQQVWLSKVEVPWSALRTEFQSLSLRHTAKYGFRTYDLPHVASARLLGCDEFWSFDKKARELAALEGLRVNSLS